MTKQELFWELKGICERIPKMSTCDALLPGHPVLVKARTLWQLENFVDEVQTLLKTCESDKWEDKND